MLYNSPESKEKEFTDSVNLQTAPSHVHLKVYCGVENLVSLEGDSSLKNHQDRTMLFAWLFETFHVSEGEKIPEPPVMKNSSPCISGKLPVFP